MRDLNKPLKHSLLLVGHVGRYDIGSVASDSGIRAFTLVDTASYFSFRQIVFSLLE